MKFFIIAVVFLSAVAADVSQLDSAYLPPTTVKLAQKHHVSYIQKNQELPQAAVQEVVDNSVVENISVKEQKVQGYYSQPSAKSSYFGSVNVNDHTQTAKALAHHIQNAAPLAHQVKDHATVAVTSEEYTAPSSDVYQSNQKQASYYTQINQQAGNKGQQEGHEHNQYNTGATVQKYGKIPQQQQKQNYHVAQQTTSLKQHKVVVTVPEVQNHNQPQKIYGQQSHALHSTATNEFDTQYAENGGYVY